ncbi:MAG: Endonuclease III [Candidatus Saccharicenans subterraneus]|uniref:Endonuclease III n=1 Tax=Candidatus Saccharicenans subterraneus TaxID=2508984 RepID=A0A3E2BL72_9BACT|nr:MAG: Endonuclease III [Candidatus Saccharicenans subterraneum]
MVQGKKERVKEKSKQARKRLSSAGAVPGDLEERKKRIKEIIKILRKEYPQPKTALNYRTPFELLVATILAAQCTDERVNKVTPGLFQKYPTVEAMARARQEELENDIRSTGFFRNKARNIIGLANKLVSEYGGKVPDTMEELVKLPGVARKTANIVLSSAFRKAEGIAVDTHVRRLSERLGLSRQSDPDKIERDLMEIVPREDWLDFNFLLVDHGRKVCQARKPLCPQCVIKHLCPSFEKFSRLFSGRK